MITKKCARCKKTFDCKKLTAKCDQCKTALKRIHEREQRKEMSSWRRTILDNTLPLIPEELHQAARAEATRLTFIHFHSLGWKLPELTEVDGTLGTVMTMSVDRQPPGYKTRKGSDDGSSTYYEDLANQLDLIASEAAEHSWWSKHPECDVYDVL